MAHGFSFWVPNIVKLNRPVLLAKKAVSDENLDKTIITEQQVQYSLVVEFRGRCFRRSAVSVIVSTQYYRIHKHALFVWYV